MAIVSKTYTAETNFNITLASLANGSARQSVAVDNTTDLFLDAAVRLSIRLVPGVPTGDQLIRLWFYGSFGPGNLTDNATGFNSPITLRNPTNLLGPFVITTPDDAGIAYTGVVGSVANYFGGQLPRRWGIVVENRTGLAFDATEANHAKVWTGQKLEIA